MKYRMYLLYVLRILNVGISAFVAAYVYDLIYKKYVSYLPASTFLEQLNTQNGLGAILRENSQGYREMYFHIFERSVYFSIASFVVSFLIIEYFYRSKDRATKEAARKIYEHLGAWKERNVMKNSDITKENQDYLKDYFK